MQERRGAAIAIANLRKEYGEGAERVVALDGIDLTIAPGEFCCIVGPSGCGKSTLLDLLGGLTRPTSGRILIGGSPVTGPALDRGLVFQQYALFSLADGAEERRIRPGGEGCSCARTRRPRETLPPYGGACGVPRPLSS